MARLGSFIHVSRSLLAYRLSDVQHSSPRANEGKASLELVHVSSMIWRSDPGLRASQGDRVRTRHREFCLGAAREMAERRRVDATKMLFAAAQEGGIGLETFKVAVKILMPSALLRLARAARARSGR